MGELYIPEKLFEILHKEYENHVIKERAIPLTH